MLLEYLLGYNMYKRISRKFQLGPSQRLFSVLSIFCLVAFFARNTTDRIRSEQASLSNQRIHFYKVSNLEEELPLPDSDLPTPPLPKQQYATSFESSFLTGLLPSTRRSNEAYVTFLRAHADPEKEDAEFESLRRLIWQLARYVGTRDRYHRDTIVMVSSNVASWRIETLREDGALVKVVKDVEGSESLAKLRMWELTGYRKLLYLDYNTVILRNLQDSSVWKSKCHAAKDTKGSGGIFRFWRGKQRYCFGALPMEEDADTFHSKGVFYLSPNQAVFSKIRDVAAEIDEPTVAKVLNQVFSKDGDMPWTQLPKDLTDSVTRRGVSGTGDRLVSVVHRKYLFEHKHLTEVTAKLLALRQGYL